MGPSPRKTCQSCGRRLVIQRFYTTAAGNPRGTCKECQIGQAQVRYRNGIRWDLRNRGKSLVAHAKQRSKQKGLEFDLDPEDIQRRVDAGSCEVTGIPFEMDPTKGPHWNGPSLDRIDSGRGYTMDNVRVVLWSLNVMAHTWGLPLIHIISDAIRHNRWKQQNDTPTD